MAFFRQKTFFNLNLKEFKDDAKLTLSTISGAFMLPISTMAITALFLVIGTFLEINNRNQEWLFQIGKGIKSISYPILNALPLLFCVAFAIKFTKNDGLAVWSAIIAYLVFTYIQSAFIVVNDHVSCTSSSSGCCHKDVTYKVFFDIFGLSSSNKYLVHKFFGVYTLNTSIIGSLIIGGIVIPYIYKHYSNVQFPKYLAYFSGSRFLPLGSALAMIPLALFFLIFWPVLGKGMSSFGNWFAKTPYGIDSFIFGFLEKSLIPTGLHHIFASSLWYTSLGGDAAKAIVAQSSTLCSSSNGNCTSSCLGILANSRDATQAINNIFYSAMSPLTSWQGDSFIGVSALSLPGNTINNVKVFDYFANTLNMKVGRFTQGKFPIMQFGLPAAGLAMIMAAPKANRKVAIAQLVPSILTCFIIGITEPLEFSFLFIAPKLFYGFHAVMCGFSFLLMNVFGAHIPTVFSGGVIEFLIFGVALFSKGTYFYWHFAVGAILAPIYFTVFYAAITKYNLATPGRGDAVVEETNLETKTEEAKEAKEVNENEIPTNIKNMAIGFGGWDNLGETSCCASRLRYDIIDKSKVNEAVLKKSGVLAVKWVGEKHLHAIVGTQAENIHKQLIKWKGTELNN